MGEVGNIAVRGEYSLAVPIDVPGGGEEKYRKPIKNERLFGSQEYSTGYKFILPWNSTCGVEIITQFISY